MRLLFVTYEFPPKGGIGVQRPLKTARYLAEDGWDITVLTVKDPPTSLHDQSLLGELPDSVTVEAAWSLEPTRMIQLVLAGSRAIRFRRSQSADSPSTPVPDDSDRGRRSYSRLPSGLIRLVQAFFIPDEKLGWTPWAVSRGRHLHSRRPFDCILASGPPFTAFLVAHRLSESLGIPWVADLRDPIVGGYFFRPLTPLNEMLLRQFESHMLTSAQRIIVAAPGFGEGVASRVEGVEDRIAFIPNGFDPADFEACRYSKTGEFRIAYVGAFQGDIEPSTFFSAVSDAMRKHAGFAQKCTVRIVGPRDRETPKKARQANLAGNLELAGFVSHDRAVAEMCRADLLVLILGSSPAHRDIIPGKLPEYLASGRPILAITPEGMAAGIIRRAGAGWVVDPADTEAATRALLEAYHLWEEDDLPVPNSEVVAEFDRRKLVRRLGYVLQEIVQDTRTTRRFGSQPPWPHHA